jgi:ribonuclease HII
MNEVSDKSNYKIEARLISSGYSLICGIDEAGRGSLSGPVVAGACILDSQNIPDGIKDSKLLPPTERLRLFKLITTSAISWAAGIVDNYQIDQINILQATKKAMALAVENLRVTPDCLLIDALTLDNLKITQKSYIKGDVEVISIGAASIIAKVTRDEIMSTYHILYPQYNWKQNKGYPTREHLHALTLFGPTEFHRRTFKGVL